MTLLIRGGQLLDRTQSVLERADVLIEGERIVAVGPELAAPADAQRLDATGHVVLPGLINAHTHAHINLTRCLAGNWTLEDLSTHGPALSGGRRLPTASPRRCPDDPRPLHRGPPGRECRPGS